MGVDASWHEDMRGRARALLILVADRLTSDTTTLVDELIDSNEYGVALEIIRDMLVERDAPLSPVEDEQLESLLRDMGLDRSSE